MGLFPTTFSTAVTRSHASAAASVVLVRMATAYSRVFISMLKLLLFVFYLWVSCDGFSGQAWRRGQKISVKITQFGPLGASCTINGGKAYGLCTQDQIAWFRDVNKHELAVNDVIEDAFVMNVTDEGRIDISLKEIGRNRVDVVKEIVLSALEGSPEEVIPVGDKTSPENIGFYLYGVSKTEFKQAVGALYRDGLVIPGQAETRLSTEEEKSEARARAAELSSRDNGSSSGRCSSSADGAGGKLRKSRGNIKNRKQNSDVTVFVGNLPVSINEVILRNTVIKVLGEACLADVRIPRRDEGFAQYGYIDLVDAKLVPDAVRRLKGVQCMGRRLRTDFATRPRGRN